MGDRLQTVTHPSTNRARRRLTLMMRPSMLLAKPNRHLMTPSFNGNDMWIHKNCRYNAFNKRGNSNTIKMSLFWTTRYARGLTSQCVLFKANFYSNRKDGYFLNTGRFTLSWYTSCLYLSRLYLSIDYPKGWVYLTSAQKYYRVIFELMDWNKADMRCRELGAYSRLVDINDDTENTAVKTFIASFDGRLRMRH